MEQQVRNVDIILVNWNAGSLTLEAVLPYLEYKSDTIRCNVIVVDNASSDNSVLLLKEKIPNLILNDQNLGFGKACNEAYLQCTGDYILLLNPDANSTPAALEGLVSFLEKHPAYAVAGPKQLDQQGNVMRVCGRFPTFYTALLEVTGLSKIMPAIFTPVPIMKDWDHLQSRDVDHVMGSYMLIRRSVINITGFMDDDYFVYYEDLDLSKRIHLAGFKVYYNTGFSIVHEGGGTGPKAKVQRLVYALNARRIYWKKHLNKFSVMVLTFFSLTAEPPLRLLDILIRERKFAGTSIRKAYAQYIKNVFKN